MIARTWHGVTQSSKADAYFAYLKESGLKEYRETRGTAASPSSAGRRATGRTSCSVPFGTRSKRSDASPVRISTARSTIQRTKSSSSNSSRPSRTTRSSHHPTKTPSVEAAARLRRLGDRRIVQAGSGPDRHPLPAYARRGPRAFPPDDLHARLPEIVRLPDVHPYSIDAGPVQRHALRQELREEVLREIEFLVRRDELEHLGLEDVDAGVHEAGERLLFPRLLFELLDSALRVESDDPVLRRIVDIRQRDRDDAARPLVELEERLEVDITQDVAHRDDERLVDEIRDATHRARGACRVLLEAVEDRGVVVQSFPD